MITLGLFILVIVSMCLAGRSDYIDAKREQELYCKMVNIWEREKGMGIPSNERNGWPRFNKQIKCT